MATGNTAGSSGGTGGISSGGAWLPPSNSVSAQVTVTSGAVNVKGAYAELIASSAFECDAILIKVARYGTSEDFLLDIATGGAGSEVVQIPNLGYSGSIANNMLIPDIWLIPLKIASGSRISARCQDGAGALTLSVYIILLKELFPVALTRVTDYGTATADSGGTSVDPGAVVNTKGAYSQLSASITNPTKAVMIHIGNQRNIARVTTTWKLDIATGAAASEVVRVADVIVNGDLNTDMLVPQTIGPIPLAIAAGTRLAARAQCDITDAIDRLIDVMVYGID